MVGPTAHVDVNGVCLTEPASFTTSPARVTVSHPPWDYGLTAPWEEKCRVRPKSHSGFRNLTKSYHTNDGGESTVRSMSLILHRTAQRMNERTRIHEHAQRGDMSTISNPHSHHPYPSSRPVDLAVRRPASPLHDHR